MLLKISNFLSNRSGVTAIEYGLIAAMVGVAIIGGVTLLGTSLDGMFTNVSASIDSTQPAPAPAP